MLSAPIFMSEFLVFLLSSASFLTTQLLGAAYESGLSRPFTFSCCSRVPHRGSSGTCRQSRGRQSVSHLHHSHEYRELDEQLLTINPLQTRRPGLFLVTFNPPSESTTSSTKSSLGLSSISWSTPKHRSNTSQAASNEEEVDPGLVDEEGWLGRIYGR